MITNFNQAKKRNSNGQSIENKNSNAPKYFDNSIPRSGKWSPEEEVFANRLIAEFEAGSLMDCEDGCTLRSYLAKKLNCAPMRISKKFAGQCIGKHVFARKVETNNTQNEIPDSDIGYQPSYHQQSTVPILSSNYPKFYDRNDYLDNNSRASKAALVSILKKQINAAMNGQSEETNSCVGLDIDDPISDLANSMSHNSFGTNCEFTDNYSSDEAEEWKNVLSFFCCDGIALTPEQIEAGMSLVRRDSSFIIKSNSLRMFLNANENC